MRPLSRKTRTLVVFVPCAAALQVMSTAYAGPRDLDVKVQIVGDEFRTSVSLFVPAARQYVWEVLTDYERAPQFTPDLQVSKVLRRSGDTLRLFQKTLVRWGPFSVPVETVSDIRLSAPDRTEAR